MPDPVYDLRIKNIHPTPDLTKPTLWSLHLGMWDTKKETEGF